MEKNFFLTNKNKKFKKSKKWDFSKGVSPWFWFKIAHFSTFFLGNIGQKSVFYDILERKKGFLRHKNKKFKKWKNRHFSKVHGFGQKLAIFLTLYFKEYRPGKCVLRYSRWKKRLSNLQNKKLKNSKNWDVSKEVSPWFWPKSGHFPHFIREYKPEKC